MWHPRCRRRPMRHHLNAAKIGESYRWRARDAMVAARGLCRLPPPANAAPAASLFSFFSLLLDARSGAGRPNTANGGGSCAMVLCSDRGPAGSATPAPDGCAALTPSAFASPSSTAPSRELFSRLSSGIGGSVVGFAWGTPPVPPLIAPPPILPSYSPSESPQSFPVPR